MSENEPPSDGPASEKRKTKRCAHFLVFPDYELAKDKLQMDGRAKLTVTFTMPIGIARHGVVSLEVYDSHESGDTVSDTTGLCRAREKVVTVTRKCFDEHCLVGDEDCPRLKK